MIPVRKLWLYYRTGSSNYIAQLTGLGTNILIYYVLFLEHFPVGAALHLLGFAVLFTSGFIGVSVFWGWFHWKYIAPKTDLSIGVIATPYTYKIQPGKEQLLFIPFQIFVLGVSMETLDALGRLTPEMKKNFDYWLKAWNEYLEGKEFRESPNQHAVR